MATVLDLFAGGGGFSWGFQQAGFDVARAVENFRPKAETYRENFPKVDLWVRDVQDTVIRDPYDVVIGGPPCEPFTTANARRQAAPLDRLYKDKIGSLLLQFIRIVGDVRPRVFLMENVVQAVEGPLLGELRRHFGEHGFPRLYVHELLAENAGTPSHRRRVFLSNVELKPPPARAGPIPVRQALEGLPPPGPQVPNHDPHPLTADKRQRLARLRPGQAVFGYEAATGKRHQIWLRLAAGELAPTVLGQSRFVHPTEDRLLTVREHARLMGYPDTFRFRGGRDVQYDAVGESVPPPLALALAQAVEATLGRQDPASRAPGPARPQGRP